MNVRIFRSPNELGRAAAAQAAGIIRDAIARQGGARIIVATGASQFAFLDALIQEAAIDWARVEMFHLDEYVGLPDTHPASFRRYLLDRLIRPAGIRNYHFLDGEGSLPEVCRRVGKALAAAPIHAAFVGVGENGHLAFNDPPADFETEEPYIIVSLDEDCRRQQVAEGWFDRPCDVPKTALSMSVRQILKAQNIICVVPEQRKAQAVRAMFQGEISPKIPASILRAHKSATLYLDTASASLLDPASLEASHRVESSSRPFQPVNKPFSRSRRR